MPKIPFDNNFYFTTKMKTVTEKINLSISFSQVIDLVKQLPYKEKVKLGEVIRKETKSDIGI